MTTAGASAFGPGFGARFAPGFGPGFGPGFAPGFGPGFAPGFGPGFAPIVSGAGDGLLVADAMITCPKTHDINTGVDEIRAFFDDEHVHMGLIITTGRLLVTTIERFDLPVSSPGLALAAELGTLAGRTVDPKRPLDAVTVALQRQGRRRLAVIDDRGRLLGLLCLKKDGTGYCSDESIRQRPIVAQSPAHTT